MTRLMNQVRYCSVCGKEIKTHIIMSTNLMGYQDLDTRPPEMARSLLSEEIQYCDNCHYSNRNIEDKITEDEKNYLKSEEYLEVVNSPEFNRTAKAYYLLGMRNERLGLYYKAGMAYLKSAWAFDDRRMEDYACLVRRDAFSCLEKEYQFSNEQNTLLMMIDIQRRMLDFKGAINNAKKALKNAKEELHTKILKFQIELCKKEDSGCYRVNDAINALE